MKRPLLFAVFVGLLTSGLWAQTPYNPVAEVHFNKPKPGMQSQYEEGRKRHMGWHRAQKDPWTWVTWEITTGPDTGSYVVATPGHHWKDFDGREDFQKNDSADALRNMGSTLEEERMSYWVMRADLSRNPSMETPSKMITVTRFWLEPAGVNTFTESVKKINAGIDKVKYPVKPSRWFQLMNGGEGPQFVLISDRSSMAELEPLDKTLDEAMAEAYGKDEGAGLMDGLRKTVKRSTTELRTYRADLSYSPAK